MSGASDELSAYTTVQSGSGELLSSGAQVYSATAPFIAPPAMGVRLDRSFELVDFFDVRGRFADGALVGVSVNVLGNGGDVSVVLTGSVWFEIEVVDVIGPPPIGASVSVTADASGNPTWTFSSTIESGSESVFTAPAPTVPSTIDPSTFLTPAFLYGWLVDLYAGDLDAYQGAQGMDISSWGTAVATGLQSAEALVLDTALAALGVSTDGDGNYFTFAQHNYATFIAPMDGTYGFQTTSSDGSSLFIDGSQVVSGNWQDQGATAASGTVVLKAGQHAIDAFYYQDADGKSFSVAWQPPWASSWLTMDASGANVFFVAPSYQLATSGSNGWTVSSSSVTFDAADAPSGAMSGGMFLLSWTAGLAGAPETAPTVPMLLASASGYQVNVSLSPPPNAPTDLTASSSTNTSVTLGWALPTAISGVVIDHYLIEYDATVGSGSQTYSQSTTVSGGTTTSATVSGLSPNTSYAFRLSSFSTASKQSTSYATVGGAYTAPDPPTALSLGTTTASTQVLSWTAPSSTTNVAYTVKFATNSGMSGATTSVATISGTSITAGSGSDSPFTWASGTTYYWTVTARNTVSSLSNTSSVLTSGTAANLFITIGSVTATSAKISWTKETSLCGSYLVKYGTTNPPTSTWTTTSPALSGSTYSVTVSGLATFTSYYMTVKPLGPGGAGSGQTASTKTLT